jgi:phosphatidate cytidylyltransferase
MMAIGLGVLVADYFIGLDICFHGLILLVAVPAFTEFFDMCETSRTGPFRRFGTVAGLLLIVLHWAATPGTLGWFGERLGRGWLVRAEGARVLGDELVFFGLAVAVLGSLWLQATKRINERTFESPSSTLFGVLYLWFLSSFLVKLRHLGSDGHLGGPDWNATGTGLLVACLAVSKLSDVGAYLAGRKIGRTKLIPRISPNKTWEGLAAGIALSIGVSFVLWAVGLLPFGAAWHVSLFGFLVGVMGALGDLAESLLKRGSGVKDTGAVVPGFGGVLDVIDSLLLSAPVAYFLSVVLLRLGV